jgi:signal transduction histidine kinase/ligand-binding sensor domain-containing protein/DNA-binding response OmpR family regulator
VRLTKIILLAFLIVNLGFRAFGQEEINFTSLTTRDGLSSNSVNAILKDHFGLLWFGTVDGLNKFDGTNFTVYRNKPGNFSTLPTNEILSLHEDNAGNLWVGTGGGSLSLYDRKKDVFINFPSRTAPNSISNNVINAIYSDYKGKIWIGHWDGISILDPATKKVTRVPDSFSKAGAIVTKPCLVLFEDSRHSMWMGTNNGLYQYSPKTKSVKEFLHSSQSATSLINNNITAIKEDKAGNMWIGTNGGLSMLKKGGTGFVNYVQGNDTYSLSSNTINSVDIDDNKIWIGTNEGLDILNPVSGQFQKLSFNHRNIHSLTAQEVKSIYIDKSGIYWLGMTGGGINKHDKNLNLFNFVQSNVFDQQGLNAPVVTSFAEKENGKVYVGTDGGGLSLFDCKTKLFQHLNIRSARRGIDGHFAVMALEMTKKKKLFVGTYGDGLFMLDPASGNYTQLLAGSNAQDLNSNSIFTIKEDSKGNIWVGTNGEGLNVLSAEGKVLNRYTPNPKLTNDIRLAINGYIRDIEEDKGGNIWIATHGGGIAVFHPSSNQFSFYNTTNSKLPNDKVLSLHEDSKENIWAATYGGGVAVFNRTTNQFQTFSETEGLKNNTCYKVLEDKNGLIWVSTNRGISSIDFATKKINNYNGHNGVQTNNFVHDAGLRLSSGELFFGGQDGFNYFNPAYLKKNNNAPAVLITDLRVSNQSVIPSAEGPIKEHVSFAREINLDYKQNFSLSFVGLNYTSPEQNQYAYKLEGLDKDWNYVSNSTSASYTNLDPGEYVFRVKASNNDGVWNYEGTSIKIYVHPPFWRTTLAYILYAWIIIGLVLYLRYRSFQKLKRKFALEQDRMRLEQERKETERLHELDRLKIKFLTNLSHDFRTPISLILGPVDSLLTKEGDKQSVDQLSMIKRNGRRLLNLVNQLLDFRKMESQELKLNTSNGELVSFINEVTDSFKDFSERKKIDFVYISVIDQLYTRFDHDKMERILFNLLSNAFKFTLEGGRIALTVEKLEEMSDDSTTWVSISISDTGIGIEENQKEQIFERFFQTGGPVSVLNQGTGIGLSITKEFIKMHGGTIDVESQLGRGTTFSIRLPLVTLEAPVNNGHQVSSIQIPEVESELSPLTNVVNGNKTNGVNGKTEMPTILLVEDNEDFRFYLKENLRLHYKVFEAANGKEGWQKALAHHPMLIVSDISMPHMNGIELTQKIKSDKRTSHIPVILLTALTGEQDQIKGLETGANDYITKPFNFEVLNAKIKNLLELNSSLKNTYTRQIKVLTPEVEIESDNEKLLNEIMLYIDTNLTDSQLSVEELSRHVGMSRSSLYNKLLELTGQSPVEYIRSVKLDKAAVLLEKSEMNVAQIAYSVGFATPNYFAKSFKAKFNMLPSEYLTKMRKKNGEKLSG